MREPAADGDALARATADAIVAFVRGSRRAAGWSFGKLEGAARWAWPRSRKLGLALARASGRAIAGVGRWTWTHRIGLARAGQRLLWWTALAMLVVVGRALVGIDSGVELEWFADALPWLIAGLAMAAFVLVAARETRLRRAAFVLAGAHGSLALLVWLAGA